MPTLSAKRNPTLTEQGAGKIVRLPCRSDRGVSHVLRRDSAVVYLRVSAEGRIIEGCEAYEGAHMVPIAGAVGRLLDEAVEPALLEHWSLAIEQARELRQEIPITYEWQREGLWFVRTATFVPRLRGAIDVYVHHLGTRPKRRRKSMRTLWVLLLIALVAGCATPQQRAQVECERQVANEMGYDVMPDGTWSERAGHTGGGEKVVGSGKRVQDCLRARGQ